MRCLLVLAAPLLLAAATLADWEKAVFSAAYTAMVNAECGFDTCRATADVLRCDGKRETLEASRCRSLMETIQKGYRKYRSGTFYAHPSTGEAAGSGKFAGGCGN